VKAAARALSLALMFLTGAARAQPPNPQSDEAGLWMQVAKAEDELRTSPSLIRDARLNDYVRDVACRLVTAACPGLRVYVVEAPGENVIALPNGALVVWSGTLLRTENEAQLAPLLGHELAHYLHKDSLAQFHRMLDTSGAVALLGVAASGVGLDFVGTPASMAALSARYAHSESEERAADDTGFDLATAAGYDPAAAMMVWRDADAGFLKLHPLADVRLAALQSLEQALPRRAVWKTGADTHQAATALWQERWVDEELRQGDKVGLFLRLSASGRGLYRYALGEAYRKRDLPGDAPQAEAAFRDALLAPDAPALAWRGLGLTALQSGDKKLARTAFSHYRAAAPEADDKAMIDYYLAQL
jgi:beta-barrel assembly-enhancing protease